MTARAVAGRLLGLHPRLLAALVIAGIGLAGCGSGKLHFSAASQSASATTACPAGEPRIQETTGGPWVCDPDGPVTPPAPAPTPSPTALDIVATAGCLYGNTDSPSFSAGDCTKAESASDNEPGTYGDDYANDAYGDAGQLNACQVSVTNPNTYPVNVSTVLLGYYDGAGDEISDATEDLPVIQLAAGSSTQVMQQQGLPAGTVTCSATSWSP